MSSTNENEQEGKEQGDRDDLHVKLDRIEAKLDWLISHVVQDAAKFKASTQDQKNPIPKLHDFKKLKSIEDLIEFEKMLEDGSYKTSFSYFSLYGKSRNGDKNFALLDHVIYVNFLFEAMVEVNPKFQYN